MCEFHETNRIAENGNERRRERTIRKCIHVRDNEVRCGHFLHVTHLIGRKLQLSVLCNKYESSMWGKWKGHGELNRFRGINAILRGKWWLYLWTKQRERTRYHQLFFMSGNSILHCIKKKEIISAIIGFCIKDNVVSVLMKLSSLFPVFANQFWCRNLFCVDGDVRKSN